MFCVKFYYTYTSTMISIPLTTLNTLLVFHQLTYQHEKIMAIVDLN